MQCYILTFIFKCNNASNNKVISISVDFNPRVIYFFKFCPRVLQFNEPSVVLGIMKTGRVTLFIFENL